MTAQITEFQFKDSTNPWRLDLLGSLTYPGSRQSEPTVAVHLSELKPGYENLLSNKALVWPSRHKTVHVKVGQIALLTQGSVWLDGVRQVPHEALTQEIFTLGHGQFDLIRFDEPIAIDGYSATLLTDHRYRLGDEAKKDLASSWMAVAFNPGQNLKFLAIPSSVLFQKCLATSPKAVRCLVYGEIDEIIDPVCEFLADRPDILRVTMYRDFRSKEAKAFANVKVDPVGKAAFRILRNELVAASVNSNGDALKEASQTHIKFGLPFSNDVVMTVRGKNLPLELSNRGKKTKGYGFLVTEIVGLQTELVFDNIVIQRKNDSRQGENSDDPNLEPYGPIKRPTPVEATEPNQPLSSGTDPSDRLDELALEAAGDFEATNWNVIDDPKELQRYKSLKWVRQEDEEFEGTGTTGEPSGGGKGTAPVDIKPEQTPNVPITLDHFFAALKELVKRKISFETVAVSNSHRKLEGGSHVVNFLPSKIKRVRSWHLVPKDKPSHPRAYVVAKVFRGAVWHYLIEVEHKIAGEMALLHLYSIDGSHIEPQRIEWFMTDVAIANGWSGAMESRKNTWIFKSVRHSPQKSGVMAFADAIEQAL